MTVLWVPLLAISLSLSGGSFYCSLRSRRYRKAADFDAAANASLNGILLAALALLFSLGALFVSGL